MTNTNIQNCPIESDSVNIWVKSKLQKVWKIALTQLWVWKFVPKNTTMFCKNAQNCTQKSMQTQKINTAEINLHWGSHLRPPLFASLGKMRLKTLKE